MINEINKLLLEQQKVVNQFKNMIESNMKLIETLPENQKIFVKNIIEKAKNGQINSSELIEQLKKM